MHKKNIFVISLGILVISSIIGLCLVTGLWAVLYSPLTGKVRSFDNNSDFKDGVKGSASPIEILSKKSQKETSSNISEIDLAFSTLSTLEREAIPESDLIEIAGRLRGIKDAPGNKKEIPDLIEVGNSKEFWVLNVDKNSYRNISATLAAQTDHLNFWIEDGLTYQESQVNELADVFENQIYSTTREIFGSEWSPGVDNDVRLVILYARELGSAAGYHSSKDALVKQIDPYSNEAEMFYLSADYLGLNDPNTYGVLAHEFQHMIHWNVDRNEEAWLNEGMSELAVELNSFSVSGFDYLFAINPDLQLTFWPGNDQGDSRPHYGASYLFVKYFLDRFGKDSIQELVAHPENGLKSIDLMLSSITSTSDGNFEKITAEIVFQDWTIANILNDSSIESGIFAYDQDAPIPEFKVSDILTCGSGPKDMTVNQFGSVYLSIDCDAPFKLEITAEDTVPLLPVEPFSGDYYLWSNYGDESSMQMSRRFDLSEIDEKVWLDYYTWFDIERDYDYVYLMASKDGSNWQLLQPSACTYDNPTGANYGCGYNGRSGGWINERVDLSEYAGGTVHIMFEYITDAAVNGDGFLVDDMSINAINYFSDFELDNGGWETQGFVRVANRLPQAYAVSIVKSQPKNEVEKYQFPMNLNYSFEFDQPVDSRSPIIVVSGITRYTRQPAAYRIQVDFID